MAKESPQEKEFLQLVKQHERIIYKLVNVYAVDEEEKRDLIQEILYQAWKGYAGFEGRSAFSTWLYRLSLNTIFTFRRKESRNGTKTGAVAAEPWEDEQANSSLEAKMLLKAIRELPELDRALISLHLDGYAHAEIAEVVGLTETNVRVRVHRIKKHLITTLNG
jgi:RNA polymerase sigma-70 factor (ECF subfamily)